MVWPSTSAASAGYDRATLLPSGYAWTQCRLRPTPQYYLPSYEHSTFTLLSNQIFRVWGAGGVWGGQAYPRNAILPFLPVLGNNGRPSSLRSHTQTQTKFYGLNQALTMLCRSPPSPKTTLVGCLAILHPTYHTFHTYLFGYQTQPTLAPSSNPLWSTRQLNRSQDQSSNDPLVNHHCRVTPSS